MIPPRDPPPRIRKLPIWDIATALALAGAAAFVVHNILSNMEAAGVTPGFGFLLSEAGFDVSESLIPYSPEDSYLRVIATGLLNTLFLAAVSLVLATMVGLGVGLLGVGPSPVGRILAVGYVELFRNLPKILILLVLYVVAVNGLPAVRQAISLGPIQISNRALYLPAVEFGPGSWMLAPAALFGVALSWLWRRRALRRQEETGQRRRLLRTSVALLLAPVVLVSTQFGAQLAISTPELRGFDFQGGVRLSLQFMVVAATLALYHGAQIAEVVRGGLEAVPKGQREAAAALGLSPRLAMRLVVIPQVVRIVIPPMNNQYVNLVKNTSIAIAVGYSDLMSVTDTTINQTFRPLEMMLVTMALYLVVCLGLTSMLNRWSDALRRREAR